MLLAPPHASVEEFNESPYSEGEAVDEKQLARASRIVDELTAGVPYQTDTEGHPADEQVRKVLREATCAQAAYLLETGDPAGVVAAMGSVAIGSVRLGSGNTTDSGTGASRYSPEAVALLRSAGLMTRAVSH